MSFFKKLFGQKKKALPEDKEFTQFFEDTLSRYLYEPSNISQFEFTAPDGSILPPSVAFFGAYEEWKTIQSVWDQRSVLFKSLDEKYSGMLEKWQFIERLITDRYPSAGLRFADQKGTDEDLQNVEYVTSLSRCYFFLSDYEMAHNLSIDALKIDANHTRARIALADALYMLGDHERANEIYNDILRNSKLNALSEDNTINLFDVVSFHGNILHSSVYAVGLLYDEHIEEEMWNAVAEEFYHCPYFRTQHAFWLFKKDENLKGVAKLISTTQEFPEHQDAVVNAHSTILQFREQMHSDELWEDELQTLTKIIQENNWEFAR